MAIDTIKFKRGVKSKLNNLSYGEPAYISDENELYIGTENGVEKITSNKEVKELSSQLEHKANLNTVFSMANMGQDIKEAMTGGSVAVVGENAVLSENIVNNQVVHAKLGDDVLKFNDVNLIYKVYNGSFINWENGNLASNDEYVYTDYIEVKANERKYLKVECHYAFYNESKVFINGHRGNIPGASNIEIIVPSNACYIRLSTKKILLNDFVMCNTLEFCKNGYYTLSNTQNGKKVKLEGEWVDTINIKDNSITPAKTSEKIVKHILGKNKYYVKHSGKCVDWNGNALMDNIKYNTSDYIEVEAGQRIYQSENAHYCFYDNKSYRVEGNRNTDTPSPFIVPTGAKYLRVSPEATMHNYILTIDNPDLTYEKAGTYLSTINDLPILNLDGEKFDEIDEKINEINEEINKINGKINVVEKSRFYGKKVSWYGTSVTQGYGWCRLVNSAFNFNATNNGVGGTTISRESDDSSMCTKNRMQGLYGGVYDENTGQTTYNGVAIPSDVEVIFIEGGTNDWARNWPIGNKEFSDNPDDKTFAGACHLMFKNMTELFPNAEIIVVGSPFGKLANRNVFDNKYGLLNNNNLQTVEYGDILLDIAGKWGIKGFNMGREMQVHDNNIATLIPDGLHLTTTEVQEKASNAIINYLLSLN